MSADYVVVTPVRDEVRHVGRVFDSMLAQTLRPRRWIVVDDGSSDGTAALLDARARGEAWIEVVHRPDRGRRASGGGVVESFYDGYARLGALPWQFLVKLDADLSFEPAYFEACLRHFADEPALGIAGGVVCQLEDDGSRRVDSPDDPPFHVRGATKIYRRACWQQIEPLARAPGWDTIDEVRANRHGWRTRTLAQLQVVQHKPTGAADGTWRNGFKNGRANYHTGYHPLFMLGKALRRALRRPPGLESAALLAGYASAALRRLPRHARPDEIRYLRREQLRRLMHLSSIYG